MNRIYTFVNVRTNDIRRYLADEYEIAFIKLQLTCHTHSLVYENYELTKITQL